MSIHILIRKAATPKTRKIRTFFLRVYLAGSSFIGGGIFVVPYGAEQFAKNISGDSNRVSIG